MPSIQMLKTFCAVAQAGSFSGAADRVALTQAAVSQQMRGLEESLARPLFDRSARQITLTRQGRELLPKIARILKDIDALYAPSEDTLSGPVAIGAVVSVIGALSVAVHALKTSHPELDVRLLSLRSDELAQMVERGDLDVAAVVGRPDHALPPTLEWRKLYTEPMVLVAHPDVSEDSGETVLARHPFIRFDRRVRTGVLVDLTLQRLGWKVNEYLELNAIDTIVTLIRRRVGVAILPLLHNGGWLRDPQLRIIRLPERAPEREVGMVQRTVFTRRSLTEALLAQLHQSPSV
ncbi:LysR family transcriptional regulator [Robbsia andropogonis]|uniref:LysR family transcriptional regulator n=1 Tax=Robbsia andropogonis TaxID=28092 RepID=A0A0F5JUX4_9BURK|nr:LysR family transcriptional regulator [Robbsia andropogonis]KKB61444.1 LysR family transcriptional regulator [Robbsia andropogonis]MCP1121062.1 LysR family transcriptional regulator [Robbsia andropogonis]MCP1130855.1 LysR family transcriptional regulator [Robbsia andropogonis]